MTSLLGLANLARMQNNQDELDAHFTNMEHAATGMLRLLRRLSDTGALFRSKRQTEITHVDEFIQSVKNQLKELNANDRVRIEFENKIGESFTDDPILLRYIVVNLMENGIVFSGVNDPYVKCVLAMEDQQLTIVVTDNGTGISPVVKDRIFDMFYRGSERSIGNGLGLFMVKKTLEILDGSIEVKSEPNQLTTVTIRIPQAYADSAIT
jgi:signal transduction histidine kinase